MREAVTVVVGIGSPDLAQCSLELLAEVGSPRRLNIVPWRGLLLACEPRLRNTTKVINLTDECGHETHRFTQSAHILLQP